MEDRLQHQTAAHEPQLARTNRVCSHQGQNQNGFLLTTEGESGSRSGLAHEPSVNRVSQLDGSLLCWLLLEATNFSCPNSRSNNLPAGSRLAGLEQRGKTS